MTALDDETSGSTARGSWALLPIVLLGSLLTLQGVLVALATSDEGFAIEPDYYGKATRWDAQRERERRSDRLGFEAAVELVARAGAGALSLRLSDADGRPVSGAEVSVEAFPNARATELSRVTLTEAEPGTYRGAVRSARLGLWELRIVARVHEDEFLATKRVDMVPELGAQP